MLSVRGSARTIEMQVDILVAKDGRKKKEKGTNIFICKKERKRKQHRIVLQGQ